MTAQERAAEVIRQMDSAIEGAEFWADCAAALAKAGLLVDDDTARLVKRDALAQAMQEAWDDFVSDTGCFPDCFRWEGGNGRLYANFAGGNFASFVADRLAAIYREAEVES